MNDQGEVSEARLERNSRRFGKSGGWFLAACLIIAVPGIVLIVLGHSWVFALGLALVAIALVPGIVAGGLAVLQRRAHWAARRRPFA